MNDRTAKNVIRPNPNGSAISTERSAEQFGRTSAKITSNYRGKNWQKIMAKNNCNLLLIVIALFTYFTYYLVEKVISNNFEGFHTQKMAKFRQIGRTELRTNLTERSAEPVRSTLAERSAEPFGFGRTLLGLHPFNVCLPILVTSTKDITGLLL